MKHFEGNIEISIPIQVIANLLHNEMNPQFKHRDNVVEAIIATAIEKRTISHIYNALVGFDSNINFKVGDTVLCTDTVSMYSLKEESNAYISGYYPMGKCVVKEVNQYAENQLRLEYLHVDSRGSTSNKLLWVSMSTCTQVPKPAFVNLDTVEVYA